MAKTSRSPFGRTRAHVVWDTDREEFIHTPTGEIISADKAVLQPEKETYRFFTKEGYKRTYQSENTLIHQKHALKIIRDELRKVPEDWTVNIRGLGGSKLYPNEWWTTPPMGVDDLLEMNDEQLSEWCFELEEPAFIIEVAAAED